MSDQTPDDFDERKLAMARLLHIKYSPHQPYLKQARFLLDFQREALYGGAAGGGKSDALLMGALQFVDVPGYAAILFRRSYADLSQPGALMDRAREWFFPHKPDGVRWSEIEHKWTFPSGATISFAYIDKVQDHLKYQGAEFQYIGFDELTQFKEKQYRYLFSRLRKVDDPEAPLSKVPLRMRAACVDYGDVLTEQGWMPIEDVLAGDLVYSVDSDGDMSLKPVEAAYKMWTDEPLVQVSKKNLSMSMTTDHRVVYRKFGSDTYHIGAWDLHDGRTINVARSPLTYSEGTGYTNPLGWDNDTFIAYLGLFLAEGSTNSKPINGNYKVIVTQNKTENHAAIRRLLDQIPHRYNYSKNGDFQITGKAVWSFFRKFGKSVDKHVPPDFLALATTEQLQILLDWMVLGDGHVRNGNITYVTCSPQLADDVMEIGVKLGYKVQSDHKVLADPNHNDRWTVYLATGHETKVDKNEVRSDVTLKPFSGNVYCIKVADNENFVLRQDGKVWLSGNTNPGGPGHHWVYLRFVKPWENWMRARTQWAQTDAETRIALEMTPPGPQPAPHFHPATIEDNPFLSNGDYDESLQMLDQVTKAQLRQGDWQITPDGRVFKRQWFDIVPEAPSDARWVRWWDLAATEADPDKDPDWTAGALVGITPQGIIFVKHMIHMRSDPHEVERTIRQTALADGRGVAIGMEQEPGSAGKPLYDGSMILMGDGTYKRLDEVEVGDQVITHEGRSQNVSEVHVQGVLPTVRISTRSGRSVVAALDHPFLTPAGWIQAGDLRSGMTLGLTVPNIAGETTRTDEEFRMAGYFVGDGACGPMGKNTKSVKAQVSCFDPLQEQDLLHCARSLGWEWRNDRPGSFNFRSGVQDWLREAGLAGKLAYSKRVPEWVFTAPNDQVAQFLGAYFACDGHVTASTKNGRGLEFYSVSPDLLSDVQHLLLRFGITSRLKMKVGQYLGNRHESWRLSILASNDGQARFAERIPVYGVKAATLAEGFHRSVFDASLIGDEIIDIELFGGHACRCLTVDIDHTFTTDDLVVHNTVISHYRRIVLAGFEFHGKPSSGSKIERAKPFAGRAGRGDVKLVAGAWIPDFLDEVDVFPDGEHDDQVDAVSSAYLHLTSGILGLSGNDGSAASGTGFKLPDMGQANGWRNLDMGGDDGWAA